LNGRNVLPYWSYDYMPETLQPVTGDYKSPPMNLPAWQAVLHAFAAHFRATGHRVGYQEIYNEPDNRDFWSGTEDNYLRLFDYGARGIKAGDPDAVVVGPALAFTNDWVPRSWTM
jgi:xylan 1,4-beta-xylosidase